MANISELLRTKTDENSTKCFKDVFKFEEKYVRLVHHISFMKKCRKRNVYAKHIKRPTTKLKRLAKDVGVNLKPIWKFEKQILDGEINNLYKQMFRTCERLWSVEKDFSSKVHDDVLFSLYNRFRSSLMASETKSIQSIHDKKMTELIAAEDGDNLIQMNDKWLKNTTDVPIPDNVNRILQLGPNFAVKTRKIPTEEVITSAEFIMCRARFNETKKGQVRHKLIDNLKSIRSWSERETEVERQLKVI